MSYVVTADSDLMNRGRNGCGEVLSDEGRTCNLGNYISYGDGTLECIVGTGRRLRWATERSTLFPSRGMMINLQCSTGTLGSSEEQSLRTIIGACEYN